jgi:outer membrane lipoprotein-sorting protein
VTGSPWNSTTYTIYSTDGLKSNTIRGIQKKPSGMWVYYDSPGNIISFFNGFSWTSYEVQNTICGSPYVYESL